MGTGKSVVGRLLAKRLKRAFLDLDEKIARDARQSIAQVFATEGEAGFRLRESKTVEWASHLNSHVIATGGGVMLDPANVRLLKESGKLICLTARPEAILKRIFASLPSRPLLTGSSPRERIEELLRLRAPFYAQADVAIDTSDRPVQDLVEEILKWVKNE